MGLAEKKKKVARAVDPNNHAWSKDTGRFGFRLLEKMGWADGQGLGTNRDGVTKHIVVKHRTTTLGIGADVNTSDKWIEKASGFGALLERLNSSNPPPSGNSTTAETTEPTSTPESSSDPKKAKKAKKDKKSKKRSRSDEDSKSAKKSRKGDPSSSEDASESPPNVGPTDSSVTSRTVLRGHRAKFLRNKKMSTRDAASLNEILGIKAA
ncbi:hypothetical protein H4R33_004677 [Dimargaris cristalligena]|uniref:PinX1-related protein 1 n=1 Tax=Dimargaris cristalligena TaxID=215637 RepID=A0A4P9ZV54_9FUNG|nr:hypothetical protein H4R33_004677 [Dimargaris cristalligena]RKP37496.1 hypothetical protein BJ085DRAFT_40648 [Dimargaris cristalligena]|eukprot:RKP37496.1 hypothetical protein BJ085DRAFT_40648 [Dimargaris cristalligena]